MDPTNENNNSNNLLEKLSIEQKRVQELEQKFKEMKERETEAETENENLKKRYAELKEQENNLTLQRNQIQDKLISAEEIKSAQHAEIEELKAKIENILTNVTTHLGPKQTDTASPLKRVTSLPSKK